MFNATRRDNPGSLPCPCCGTPLNGSTEFCPVCGASPLIATSQESAVHRMGTPYYAFTCAVAFALLFTAVGIFLHPRRERAPDALAVRLTMEPRVFSVPAPGKADDTELPLLASISRERPVAEPFDAAHAVGVEHSAGSQGESAVTRKANPASRVRLANSLRHGHLNLARHNLLAARKDITTVLAGQPGNREAQRMRADLVSREHEREYLLAYARLCEREEQWNCARDNATYALRVDASSRAALNVLSRAIAAQRADFIKIEGPDVTGSVP